VVFGLLALWSLAAWALHAITAWGVSSAGVLTASGSVVAALGLPDALAPWIPPGLALEFTAMLSAFAPAIEVGLAGAPAMVGGLSVAIWFVWGLGVVLLVGLGFVATGLVALLRRRLPAPANSSGHPTGSS